MPDQINSQIVTPTTDFRSMTTRNKDQLYQSPLAELADFQFDAKVVGVFEDMINRSVPNYGTIIHNMAHFAKMFVEDGSNCYDLGCSLGASTLSMRQVLDDKQGVTIISVDTSADMLLRAKNYLAQDQHSTPVEFKQADVCEIKVENASLVVLNFTLQFVEKAKRTALIESIYAGLNRGGCLVLSEKVSFETQAVDQVVTTIHHQYKREQGYSDLEIAQKRDALENVMRTETKQAHIKRLNEVGFDTVELWHQHSAFCSFFCVKS
jgi:tRNA (cmo5U34)-methyltransferase